MTKKQVGGNSTGGKMNNNHGFGWKFLNPYGATTRGGVETLYPLPRPSEKWGPWFKHPNPAEPDGSDCGAGRYHLMLNLDAKYAPSDWYPWFAEWRGLIGSSSKKVGVRELRLRRLPLKVFIRLIRWGYCSGADLYRANLSGADLSGANLSGANLSGANLSGANLSDTQKAYLASVGITV